MKKLILLCLCLAAFAVQAKPLTAIEKTEMLKQFAVFQQAVRNKDAAVLKTMLAFPLKGDAINWLGDKQGNLPKIADRELGINQALFTKYQNRVLSRLAESGVDSVQVDLNKRRIISQRIDPLTPQQKVRKYHPGPDEGSFYYYDGKKKISVDGVCDEVRDGGFSDGMLEVTLGSTPNNILPCPSEGESSQIFQFRLQNGRLKLDAYRVAG